MNNTDSREEILSRIHSSRPEATDLPVIPVFDVPGRIMSNFISHLVGFDGCYHLSENREEAIGWLKSTLSSDKKIVSSVDEIDGTVHLSDFASQAEMNVIDVCVGEAVIGVGETGSLLVDDKSVGDPAAALFCTDLYLLIDRNKIVSGMQEAYGKIDVSDCHYSSFFTGPSATADIEAVHVTGAQGEISLTAVVYNCTDRDRQDVSKVMERMPQGTPLGQPDAPVRKMARYTDLDKGQDSV